MYISLIEQIMRIAVRAQRESSAEYSSYREGHRDARHAATELACVAINEYEERLAELEAQRDAAHAERDLLAEQLSEVKMEAAEVRLDLAEKLCQRNTAFCAVLGEDWELSDSQLDEVELYAILREQIDSETQAARTDLARYVAGIDEQRAEGAEVLTRLIRLVEEWERADCVSNTYECAEQVRAILRGDGPMGWERKEGGEK